MTPLAIFMVFMSQFIAHVLDNTHSYDIQNGVSPAEMALLTSDYLLRYFLVLITMGIVHLPHIGDYWAHNKGVIGGPL